MLCGSTRRASCALFLSAVGLIACDGGNHGMDATSGYDAAPFGDAPCGTVVLSFTPDPGVHVPEGSEITSSTNPPSSGEHYPIWAVWGVHTDTVPRGYYIHNEEHGGVVILYRCDGDCSATRSMLESVVHALPPEAACMGTGVDRRIVLTEDPLLDAPVAAAAWGWTYRAMCVDTNSLEAFVLAHTGHAPEDFCSEGSYQ